MSVCSRLMGLDVGDVRIGVALTDPAGILAMPHSNINASGNRAINEIIQLVRDKQVSQIVIGLPLELSGQVGTQAKKVQEFSEKLKIALSNNSLLNDIKIHYVDERLTSAQAERVVAGSGLKNKDRRQALDKIAATLILETHISRLRGVAIET